MICTVQQYLNFPLKTEDDHVSIHPARARSRKFVIDDGEAAAVRLRWHQTNQNTTKRKRHPPNSKLEMLLVYLVPGTSYQYTAKSNPAVVCTTSAPGTWYWCSYYQVPVRTYLVLDTLVLVFIRSGCCGPVVGRRAVPWYISSYTTVTTGITGIY